MDKVKDDQNFRTSDFDRKFRPRNAYRQWHRRRPYI